MFVLTQSVDIWGRRWSYVWRRKKHALFLFQMVVGFINVFKDSPLWWVDQCATYIRIQANEYKLWSYCGLMLSSSDRGGWSLLPSHSGCEVTHVLLYHQLFCALSLRVWQVTLSVCFKHLSVKWVMCPFSLCFVFRIYTGYEKMHLHMCCKYMVQWKWSW